MTTIVTRASLGDAVADAMKCKKAEGRVAVDTMFDAIAKSMASGAEVNISNFGVFHAPTQEAREFRNPVTGDPVHKGAHRAPKFRASKSLKDQMTA